VAKPIAKPVAKPHVTPPQPLTRADCKKAGMQWKAMPTCAVVGRRPPQPELAINAPFAGLIFWLRLWALAPFTFGLGACCHSRQRPPSASP
jgi:hypothetical protein